jgi:cytochrome c553
MSRALLAAAFVAGAAFAASVSAQSADPNLGRNLAAACANCHGTNGMGQGGFPSLAGEPRSQISRLMQEFKSGKRPATVMHQLAKGYTDEQIEALAAYFSAQKAK